MKDVLTGYKTKITAWVMALIPLLALLGVNVDKELTLDLVYQWIDVISVVYILLGASAHYFRNLAKK